MVQSLWVKALTANVCIKRHSRKVKRDTWGHPLVIKVKPSLPSRLLCIPSSLFFPFLREDLFTFQNNNLTELFTSYPWGHFSVMIRSLFFWRRRWAYLHLLYVPSKFSNFEVHFLWCTSNIQHSSHHPTGIEALRNPHKGIAIAPVWSHFSISRPMHCQQVTHMKHCSCRHHGPGHRAGPLLVFINFKCKWLNSLNVSSF